MKTKSLDLLCALSEFFCSYLENVKGFSRNTVISYQYAFQMLFEYMNDVKNLPPEKVTFGSLTGGIIAEYLSWLEASRGCSAQTRNQRLAAMSSFAKYVMRKSFGGDSLVFCSEVANIPTKKVPKNTDVKYFTKEEISIILSLPDTKREIGLRDVVLLSVLYSSGARAQEICDLTLNDITFGTNTKLRLIGKGNKARNIVIPENCSKLLKGYIDRQFGNCTDNETRIRPVFSSQTHIKMSISCIEAIVKKYVQQAKKEHPTLFKRSSYSPHSFRHSIAVHMLECGESLAVIRSFLGHESISSTMVYASVTPELANRYLRERGRVLNSVELEVKGKSILSTLPFLNKVYSRGKGL